MRPADPAACRVLELGAGDGGNLLPMALALPHSTFVGIDLAGDPVARGQATAQQLGLSNLDLRQGDVLELPGDFGEFDYIIAHGLYSWIPPQPRDAVMAACAAHLAPHGVAFISYNAYPGSYLRDMARDVLRFHVDGITDPVERVASARGLMAIIAAGRGGAVYGDVLREHLGRLLSRTDASLFHDDLADVNTPVYFHEFMEHAGRHDLQFLAEARLRDSQLPELPADVAVALSNLPDDVVVREQYIDFILNRMFRQTLLCRADVRLNRHLTADRLAGSWLAAPLRVDQDDDKPDAPRRFSLDNGASAQPHDPHLRVALQAIADAWPRAVAFDDIVEGLDADSRHRLGTTLLDAHAAALVELHRCPPDPASAPGTHPCAPPLARLQAAAGAEYVTTLRHTSIVVQDPLATHLLTLLDGTRDRAALLVAVEAFVAGGGLAGTDVSAPADLPAALDAALDALAHLSLLAA
jgi:methyltransferase-like protein